uniref:Uncharacterized protein n=1 Tax=Anguilla anguilla TaxID=7936 RepID=A0A0E9URF9_ANGAN
MSHTELCQSLLQEDILKRRTRSWCTTL